MKHRMLIFVALTLTIGPARAGDDVTKALKAATSADNYSFTLKDNANAAVEAKYQKGTPLYCVADKIEFFRSDKVLVYKEKDAWQRTRTGTLSDPLRILGASTKVHAVRLPHEELAILGKAFAKSKKVDAVITAEFDADAAKKLARTEDRDLARGGTAKLWLDKDGSLAKYEIAIRVQGVRGNAELDGVMTRTVTLAGVGTTKVEVPAGARKALE